MSSISGIGQGINPYLQSLSVTPPTTQAVTTSAATATQASTDDSGTSTQAVSGGHHHHHHGGGGGLFKEIQSAVTSALQTAQANGTASDPNKVVEDAIAQVIKNHQNGSSATTTQPNASPTDPDGDGDTDGANATSATGTSARSTFDQLLQSNGVDPQQFQQDFFSAILTAQNGGSTDASNVLSNLPPGSLVDTVA